MIDPLDLALEKALPCRLNCGPMYEHPDLCLCEGDCKACHGDRPAVSALIRERERAVWERVIKTANRDTCDRCFHAECGRSRRIITALRAEAEKASA